MTQYEADSLDELWVVTLDQILSKGHELDSRNGPCKELVGYSIKLSDPRANFLYNPQRQLSPSYAAAELLWYLSGTSDISMIKEYAPSYSNYAENGYAHGAYGARIEKYDQFFSIAEYLRTTGNTRQAVMSLWWPSDLAYARTGDIKDIPCTLNLQFLLRDNKLHLVTNMRSNDAWIGLPYDIFCFTSLQFLMCEYLWEKDKSISLGSYTHNVGSMHLYSHNEQWSRAQACLAAKPFDYSIGEYVPHQGGVTQETFNFALEEEAANRRNKATMQYSPVNRHSYLGQITAMASSKWNSSAHKHIDEPVMAKYMEGLWQ